MFHLAHIEVCFQIILSYTFNRVLFRNLELRAIDWDDVFTQFKTTGFLGTYGPSKGFQILSTCSLKQKLLGKIPSSTFKFV